MNCIVVPAIVADWCPDNEGGIKSIHIIAEGDLGDTPAVDAGTWTVSTDVPLVDAANAGWVSWDFLEDSASHQESGQDSGRIQHTVNYTIPKDSAVKRYILATMAAGCCKFALGYTDNNDVTKLIRNLKLRYEYNTGLGGDNDDSNEYVVSMTKIGKAAYIYTGNFTPQT